MSKHVCSYVENCYVYLLTWARVISYRHRDHENIFPSIINKNIFHAN